MAQADGDPIEAMIALNASMTGRRDSEPLIPAQWLAANPEIAPASFSVRFLSLAYRKLN